jgi:hypothetical protein
MTKTARRRSPYRPEDQSSVRATKLTGRLNKLIVSMSEADDYKAQMRQAEWKAQRGTIRTALPTALAISLVIQNGRPDLARFHLNMSPLRPAPR